MAEDIPPLYQLCYPIVTLKYGLTPEEIIDILKPEDTRSDTGDTSVEPQLIVPPHQRIDPRTVEARLFHIDVPTFWVSAREYPLISKKYGLYYRFWLEALESNNRDIQRRSEGLQGGLDRWKNGYLKTCFYFDDLMLRNEHYQSMPCTSPGIIWHARKTPSTIYATARAILQLCRHRPTTPPPDFQSLDQEQKNRAYREIEDKISNHPTPTNFALQALAHGITGPELQSCTLTRHGRPYVVNRLPVHTFVIATVCKYQVIASQSYANFHSIDQLRQVLLDRYVGRGPVDFHCRTTTDSWEGGAPAILRRIPDDEVVKELFDIFTKKHVNPPETSDSSIGSLFDESE